MKIYAFIVTLFCVFLYSMLDREIKVRKAYERERNALHCQFIDEQGKECLK